MNRNQDARAAIAGVLFSLLPSITGCNAPRTDPAKTAQQSGSSSFPGFSVSVTLSEKAQKRLAQGKETVIVAGDLSGTPKPSTTKAYLSETGEIDLGRVEAEVAPGQDATFQKVMLKSDALQQSDDTGPQLLVNVYSGRKSSPNNLLDCGIFEGPLTSVEGKRIPIHCKLIAE